MRNSLVPLVVAIIIGVDVFVLPADGTSTRCSFSSSKRTNSIAFISYRTPSATTLSSTKSSTTTTTSATNTGNTVFNLNCPQKSAIKSTTTSLRLFKGSACHSNTVRRAASALVRVTAASNAIQLSSLYQNIEKRTLSTQLQATIEEMTETDIEKGLGINGAATKSNNSTISFEKVNGDISSYIVNGDTTMDSSTKTTLEPTDDLIISPIPNDELERVMNEVAKDAAAVAQEMVDENCEVDFDTTTGVVTPAVMDDAICTDEVVKEQFVTSLQDNITKSIQQIAISDSDQITLEQEDVDDIEIPKGELLEQGCKFA
jgi:hypothetical protein